MLHVATCVTSRRLARAHIVQKATLNEQVSAKTFAVVRCFVITA